MSPDIPTLLIASHNKGKVREISQLLAPLGKKVVSATELDLPEPAENGASFSENARIKALAAAKASGLPALSDDSGLVIPALDNQPGIYSARWAGPNKDFGAAMARIQKQLEARAVPNNKRTAYFICVLALSFPDGETMEFEGRVDGRLIFPPRGSKGFGYDPIFMPHGETRTFGEMPPQDKQEISHRACAFAQFVDYLGR